MVWPEAVGPGRPLLLDVRRCGHSRIGEPLLCHVERGQQWGGANRLDEQWEALTLRKLRTFARQRRPVCYHHQVDTPREFFLGVAGLQYTPAAPSRPRITWQNHSALTA